MLATFPRFARFVRSVQSIHGVMLGTRVEDIQSEDADDEQPYHMFSRLKTNVS